MKVNDRLAELKRYDIKQVDICRANGYKWVSLVNNVLRDRSKSPSVRSAIVSYLNSHPRVKELGLTYTIDGFFNGGKPSCIITILNDQEAAVNGKT